MSFSPTVVSIGLCSCAGVGVDAAWNLLAQNKNGFGKLELFDSPRHGRKLTGNAFGYDDKKSPTKCGKILMSALSEAMQNIDACALRSDRVGVFLGTSIGGIFETENMLVRNASGQSDSLRELAFYECSTLAEFVAKRVGAKGACMTFSTACSSSSIALAAACNAVSQGVLDAALVCGADSLSRITVNGFGSLLLLSKGACAPFDVERDGINLGEAAGVMIISSPAYLHKFNTSGLAKISGWGGSADAYHATAPNPQGAGAAHSFRISLASANISSSEISYYNAHGTGTKGNDVAEATALKDVFGADKVPDFSSIKGTLGHSLGASGILNAILSVRAIRNGLIVPNAGFKNPDEAIGLIPVTELRPRKIDHILSASLGFGGNNSSAIISREDCVCKARIVSNKDAKIFIYGSGAVSPIGTSCKEILDKIDGDTYDINSEPAEIIVGELLKEIPALKKRKWAKLQQMALQCATECLKNLPPKTSSEKIGICLGTGLGMTSETLRFIEKVLETNEAEPLPTAFTNSVHNAAASLLSIHFGFKGINSAITAKEISFESALFQTLGEIRSGAIDAAIVGSADEYSKYADMFMKRFAKCAKNDFKQTDFCALYAVGTENTFDSPPVAEILGVDLKRLSHSAKADFERLQRFLADFGYSSEDLKNFIVPSLWNDSVSKRAKELSAMCGVEYKRLDKFVGGNYSASSFAPLWAVNSGEKGLCAIYTPASTGMSALTLLNIL